jgi:hypothetical protein
MRLVWRMGTGRMAMGILPEVCSVLMLKLKCVLCI